MGKRIGTRIVEALKAVQLLEPCTAKQVHALMPGVEWSNVDKYCSRTVGHGLMTVDRSVFPKRYRTVPGWQHQLDEWAVPTRARRPVDNTAPGTALAKRHPLEEVWAGFR